MLSVASTRLPVSTLAVAQAVPAIERTAEKRPLR